MRTMTEVSRRKPCTRTPFQSVSSQLSLASEWWMVPGRTRMACDRIDIGRFMVEFK